MKIILSWHLAKGLRRQLGVWRGWIVPQLQKIGLWLIPHMQLQHQYMEYYYLPHHSFHSSRVSNQRERQIIVFHILVLYLHVRNEQ